MLEFIQSADWSILHWIQENLRCGALDALLPKLTLLGEAGAIWIAVRSADKDAPWVKTLVEAYHDDSIKTFINEEFKGALIPSW